MTSVFPLKSFKASDIIWIILILIVVNFEGGKQVVLGNRRGHSTQPVRRGARSGKLFWKRLPKLTPGNCRRMGVMKGRKGEEKS